ncbi:MAG: putative (di)nucleoside polyphosphate hydrolase, partial [Methylobacteriaceae bacterium]|nr:putative (di)nucleoside polyphosphate hydrolase [Methylobacteriaceae bacterium]
EINIEHPPGGHKPEFDAWRWEPMERLPDLIIPFKREVYQKVVTEFARYSGSKASA